MVTDLYAHTNTEDRRQLARKMERDFFNDRKQTAAEETLEDETAQALRLLKENPEMAKLIITALGKGSGDAK